jgi:hypothetical protein
VSLKDREYVSPASAAAEIAVEESVQPSGLAPYLTDFWLSAARYLALLLPPNRYIGRQRLRYAVERRMPALAKSLVVYEVKTVLAYIVANVLGLLDLVFASTIALASAAFLTHSIGLLRGWFLVGAFVGITSGFALVREAWLTRRGTITAVCLYVAGFVMLSEVGLLFRAAAR